MTARAAPRLQVVAPPAPGAGARERDALAVARDVVALAKPRLSALVLVTTAGGLALAPGGIGAGPALVALLLTAGAVAAAQMLNCWLERDVDALMKRTRDRPLPAGRLDPRVALWGGLALAAFSVPALAAWVNPATALLGGVAVASYVLVYTPLKRRSPHALYVGAVPGALPPLMGWTAVTGRVEVPGLALFALLFVWQLPHFLAIALYLRDDYRRAGIRAAPLVRGEPRTRLEIAAWCLLLVPVAALPRWLGLAGPIYLASALTLGAGLAAWAATGLVAGRGPRWARGMMLATIAYLALLFAALALDAT